jgi:hypothetical protein
MIYIHISFFVKKSTTLTATSSSYLEAAPQELARSPKMAIISTYLDKN